MKTYEETMSAIFSKGNAIITARNNRIRNIKRTSAGVSGVCAAAIIGFTVFKNDDLKNAGDLNNHNDSIITENEQTTNEITTRSSITVTEKTTSHTSKKATSTSTAITKTSANSIDDTSNITQQETITSVTSTVPAVTEKNTDNTQPVSTEQISLITETNTASTSVSMTEKTETSSLSRSGSATTDITAITETNTISTSASMTEKTETSSLSRSATTVSETNSNSNTAQITTTTSDTTNKFHPTFSFLYEDTSKIFSERFELSFIRQKFIITENGEKNYIGEPEILEKWENDLLSMPYTTNYYEHDDSYEYMLIADKLPENCTYQGKDKMRIIVQQFSFYNTIKIRQQQVETDVSD